jgi:hypothetical protein
MPVLAERGDQIEFVPGLLQDHKSHPSLFRYRSGACDRPSKVITVPVNKLEGLTHDKELD